MNKTNRNRYSVVTCAATSVLLASNIILSVPLLSKAFSSSERLLENLNAKNGESIIRTLGKPNRFSISDDGVFMEFIRKNGCIRYVKLFGNDYGKVWYSNGIMR